MGSEVNIHNKTKTPKISCKIYRNWTDRSTNSEVCWHSWEKKTGKQTTQSLFGTAFLKRPGLILGYWIEYVDFIWHPLKNKKQNEHYNHALLCSVQKKHGTYSQKVKWCIWLWCRVSVMWFSKQAGNFSLKHEQYPDHQIEVVDN